MSPAPAVRHVAIIEALARGLNDELTIIGSALSEAIRNTCGPTPTELMDARAAAQRAIWHVAAAQSYAARNGARASHVTVERLIDEARG